MKTLLMLLALIYPDLKEDKMVINKEYTIGDPENMTIIIDNINGDIEVEASGDNKLYLSLEIEISDHSDELVEQAKSELQLGQLLTDDSIMFFTKAPFIKRCKWGSGSGYDMRNQPKYAFKYQYKVKVPRQVSLEVKTVNNGDVFVKDIDGPIRAVNVNGAVEIKNAKNILEANTVNGDVTINFLESPKQPIDFTTVNGDFNFDLPDNFSAQVYFDSMNGDLYSSFNYQKMQPKITKSSKNGKFKIGTKTGIEIGANGPELSFRSINGNVYLRKSE